VYKDSVVSAVSEANMVFILTDWAEFKDLDLSIYANYMKEAVIFDG
jgi:UDPglucose 6-dehydrogenase